MEDCLGRGGSLGCGIKFLAAHLSRLIQAAGREENLPYVILAGLMLISLAVRLVLILR